jgi:hypothetical protein
LSDDDGYDGYDPKALVVVDVAVVDAAVNSGDGFVRDGFSPWELATIISLCILEIGLVDRLAVGLTNGNNNNNNIVL